MALAKMRTIPQVMEYFRREDPESGITEHYLRMLVKNNKLPVFMAGRKSLINLDKLIDFLNSEELEDDEIPFNDFGKIRKVKV